MKYLHLYRLYCVRFTAGLGVVCAVAVFMYGAFLLMAVSHTARLSAAGEQTRTLAAQVSGLESQYLTESAALTPQLAVADGFVTPAKQSVVYTAPGALTVNR